MVELQAEETSQAPIPPFSEVYDLVRSNLTGITDAELNRAAVFGFVNQLRTQVTLLSNAAASDSSTAPLVSKSAVYDGGYGLLRIGRVGTGLSQEVARAYTQLQSTNKLKGIILDLRYAVGRDYAAASQTADLFFKDEQPLLKWSGHATRSTAKSTAIDLPMVILINGWTTGAAEALGAALRQAEGVLLIGSPSAGQAYLFRDFPLRDGRVLRIASGWISVGDGQELSSKGLAPDIAVSVNPEDERAFFEDPYKPASKPWLASSRAGTNDFASLQSTNRPRRRPNEADLVRMQRDGVDFDPELPLPTTPQVTVPVVSDPALSRALDLLKGLALALKRR
jgi:C-terminal processing protease CtpA/Prc